MAGEHTRGGCCGLIESNVGNITRSDGRVKVRLKILPDEPRGSAWRPPARGVNCPVKSGKLVSDTMTQRLKLTENICYMLGIYECSNKDRISVTSSDNELIAKFSKLALEDFKEEPNRILMESDGELTTAFFYHSKLKKNFDRALDRKEHIFKYKNAYSGNYFAAIFDCNGGVDRKGAYIRDLDKGDAMILERFGIHTEIGKKAHLINQNAFVTLIREYSLKIASIIH